MAAMVKLRHNYVANYAASAANGNWALSLTVITWMEGISDRERVLGSR